MCKINGADLTQQWPTMMICKIEEGEGDGKTEEVDERLESEDESDS